MSGHCGDGELAFSGQLVMATETGIGKQRTCALQGPPPRAFDANITGNNSDFRIAIRPDVLEGFDGPSAQRALKVMHGTLLAMCQERSATDEQHRTLLGECVWVIGLGKVQRRLRHWVAEVVVDVPLPAVVAPGAVVVA